jgi:hypothetical protein
MNCTSKYYKYIIMHMYLPETRYIYILLGRVVGMVVIIDTGYCTYSVVLLGFCSCTYCITYYVSIRDREKNANDQRDKELIRSYNLQPR